MLPEAVRQFLQTHRPRHLEKLQDLLRLPSIANSTDTPDQCQICAEWLAEYITGIGLHAEVAPTAGKPSVLASAHVDDGAPTVLIYGHYDVQPPEPLGLWKSDPFEPEIRDGCLYARGAEDNKGQLFTHLMAIEAWRQTTGLPVNVKMLLEGEEEVGSPNLEPFIVDNAARLAADAAVISDSEFFAAGIPSITYALRGLAYVQVVLRGPGGDVHSGLHGGAAANPANALARLLAAMHDDDGRITLEGFYDDVVPVSQDEREAWKELPFDEAQYARQLGLETLAGGEAGYSVLERRWGRPTLDCNGLVSGYTGPGTKTIIPAEAHAKISMRLVPNQDPDRVVEAMRRFVAENAPPGTRAEVTVSAKARPVLLATDSPAMDAARDALREAFEAETALIRCGASVPVTEMFQRLLGLDAVLMGFGLPDDNVHAPNERFPLGQLWSGSVSAAAFLGNMRDARRA